MSNAFPMPYVKIQFFDDNGDSLTGGNLYSYIADSSDPQDTWVDSGMNALNSNPIELDAAGRAFVFLDPLLNYRFEMRDVLDNFLWDIDDINGNINFAQVIAALGYTPYNASNPDKFIHDLTGDATNTPAVSGVAALTLATVNTDPGTFGDEYTVPTITVNGKGLVTEITQNPIPMFDGTNDGLVAATAGGDPTLFLAGDGTFLTPPSGINTIVTSTNGYVKMPKPGGGFFVQQWGFASYASGQQTITFPVAFPTACLNVQMSVRRSGSNSGQTPTINSLAAASFTMRHADSSTGTYWYATGY